MNISTRPYGLVKIKYESPRAHARGIFFFSLRPESNMVQGFASNFSLWFYTLKIKYQKLKINTRMLLKFLNLASVLNLHLENLSTLLSFYRLTIKLQGLTSNFIPRIFFCFFSSPLSYFFSFILIFY